MSEGIGDTTEAHTVQRLSAQEASCYPVRGPRYAEPQQHSIKNSSADTEAINSGASYISISLQIEDSASADTVEALQLVSTHSPIGGEITAYTRMSIEQLERAICTEQLKDSLVQQVQQGLATPIEDRNNLAGFKMTNMNIDMNPEMVMASEMQPNMASILSDVQKRWQEIDDVVHYDGKVYVLQNPTLCNAVISQYHDDVFAGHFGKSRTAELMQQSYNWPGTVRDVQCYCHDCVECQKVKPSHHKLYRLLNSLPVPTELWHTVTMDFIMDLPLSSTYGSTT